MQENTTTLPKVYKIAFFDKDGIVTIGEELYTFVDAEAMRQTLDQNSEMSHVAFYPQRLVWGEMEYNPALDILINDADWYDEKADIVRICYSDSSVSCIPTWQIENLDEVIAKFNM